MYTSRESEKGAANLLLSWQFVLAKLFAFAMLAIYLTKPMGSLEGRVAFEQRDFHLYTYGLENRKVAAVVTGPREGPCDERGVWINPDGTFRIEQLPVGEYSLRVSAPGFDTANLDDIYVDDGKIARVPGPIRMSVLAPTVSIASNVTVYTTKENPHLWANVTGAKHVDIKVYKKDLIALRQKPGLLEGGYYVSDSLTITHSYSDYDAKSNPFGQERPTYEFSRDVELDFNDYAREEVQFNKPLPPGDYVAVADALAVDGETHNVAVMSFMVTDLGLILKRTPEMVLARAIDLNTLKPVSTVLVTIAENDDRPASSTTDKQGFARIALSKEQQAQGSHHLRVVGKLGPHRAYHGDYYWRSEQDPYRTYMYTDRPVYRLGQTVHFRGIVRSLRPDRMENPGKGMPLSITVEDPEQKEIGSMDLVTSEYGTFHGSVKIPDKDETGDYQITVNLPDGASTYQSFEVAQYRKPQFQVEVTPLVPRIVAGTRGQARIKASYYFGSPVANAQVKYSLYVSPAWGTRLSLMPRPDYYKFFDDWSEDEGDWYGAYAGGGDYVSEGTVLTDANGEALVTFDTSKIERKAEQPSDTEIADRTYRIEAEVTDLTRMTVVGSGSVLVTPADFELFVQPDSSVMRVGESFSVGVQAIDYAGKPVANQPVELKLVRYHQHRQQTAYDGIEGLLRNLFHRNQAEYRTIDLKGSMKVTTDKEGRAKAKFSCGDQWPSDTFYVVAESEDKTGHLACGQANIWISNSRDPYIVADESEAQQQPLSVKLDKHIYKPGDIAKVLVTAPLTGKEGVEAIVAVEGSEIYSYKLVSLTSTAQLVEVPIRSTYVPNVFVTVTFVGKRHQFYNDTEMIKVSPEEHFLNLTISSNKTRYKPGEKAKYTIKATHLDGTAAPNTELSLGIVDESIYAIRPDNAEDIQKFFYSKRSNQVETACSFPEEYSGGPDKTEPRVRKDFRDTAAWLPSVKTDRSGVAIAWVTLPDNLTTWRATVHAVDRQTNVGSAIQKVTVTQDLIVRLGLPRFFMQGDQGLITAVVHNYTDKPQSVDLTLTASPEFSTIVPLVQKIMVQPDKATRFNWPITVVQAGTGIVRVKAVGQTAGDAVQQNLPIRPLGIPAFSVKTGLITDSDAHIQLPIGLSADVSPGTAKYRLSLSSSTIGPVLGNFSALIDYPYGCTEQTMSRMVPSIVAYKLHNELGVPLSQSDKDRFAEVYDIAMSKLESYRHSDGAWGWWQNDDSNPYLTCLVVEGLRLLNGCHIYADTHEEWIQGGVAWLKTAMTNLQKEMSRPDLIQDRFLINEYRTDMTRMLYTVGLFEKLPPAETQWILRQYLNLPPEGLAYLTLALKNNGDVSNSKRVYERLISLSNISGQYMDWDHTRAMMKRLNLAGASDYSYRFTGVETTALALRAVLAMEPDNSKRIESIKQWLLLQHDENGWENTKTTAEVFLVLLQEELHARRKWPTNFTTEASLGEKLLAKYTFNPDTSYRPEQMVDVPVSRKPETLSLKKQGTGRLYYTGLLTCFRNLKPGDQIAEKGFPQGLRLSRKFFHLVPTATKNDGSLHFRMEPVNDGRVKAGETILMKVYVDAPVSLPYVMLEAALPSGAEVVDNSDEEDYTDEESGEESSYEGDWGYRWWSHQDVLDDRIAFFGTTLPAGKSEFHTLMRMEIPGKLNVQPVSIEGMYTKKVRAYSSLDSLTVTE